MARKTNNFITDELSWAEEQLQQWKEYVDAHPLASLKDRTEMKSTKTGGSFSSVVATVEVQGKFLQETMKNYLSLLATVNTLREGEEKKKMQARGNEGLSPFEDGTIN